MNLNDDFVEFDGRQVPTKNGLRKMGLLVPEDDLEVIDTVTTAVSDVNFWLTPDQVCTIVWNLKKYSSVTFMKQTREMLVIIVQGYEKYLKGKNCSNDDIRNIKNFNTSITMIDKVIELRLKGDLSANSLLFGIHLIDECFTGRIGDECNWSPLGKSDDGSSLSIGLYAWIEKAMNMTFAAAIGGRWTWPSSIVDDYIKYPPPAAFKYEPSKQKIVGRTGGIVPFTGIWNPFDFKSGCPSFLVVGREFPKTNIASLKYARSEYVDDDGEYHSAWVDFDYEERETQWEILWEDKRYLDGKIPKEEADYLDESCSFPTEPPEAIQN